MVTQGLSVCLALLVSFPCSRAGEANVGAGVQGDSLLATSVLSDVMHKYFARHEKQGQKNPKWMPEVQAVLSLVENMQNLKDINGTTQNSVNELVRNIITLLQSDVTTTKEEQEAAAGSLTTEKGMTQDVVNEAAEVYTSLKTSSLDAKACWENVDVMNTNYSGAVHSCEVEDFDSSASVCTCVVNSVFEFALTDMAKAVHWCDFSSDDTAQECINRLWGEVNVTRRELRNQHTDWTATHGWCESNKTECARCEPLWDSIGTESGLCQGTHSGIYGKYAALQTRETAMCNSAGSLNSEWTRQSGLQSSRASQWVDYKFIICVFEKYITHSNFTQESLGECSTQYGPDSGPDGFYEFAGQLQEPNLDMTGMGQMPACGSAGTVPGLQGLLYMWAKDSCGHDSVTVSTGNIFSPTDAELPSSCSSR